ncbi:unnamed protein product, partial [marine sediment metagenome]
EDELKLAKERFLKNQINIINSNNNKNIEINNVNLNINSLPIPNSDDNKSIRSKKALEPLKKQVSTM